MAFDVIAPDTFAPAMPAQVAARLGDDVHVWRLPYRRSERRAPLLALLADYLETDAAALTLHDDEHGKPRLFVNGHAQRDLHFNWSHSGDYALVALSRAVIPGIDIEQQREGVKAIEIAQRFFDRAEARQLAACAEDERDTMFFRLWCAKEAVLKALGRGLAFGLERMAFAREGDAWRPVRFDALAGDVAEWQVHGFNVAPGYAGALAWRGPPGPVRAWLPAGLAR